MVQVRKYRSLEDRNWLYEQVTALRKEGFGYKRIAKIIKKFYGIELSPGLICNWVKDRYNPMRKCNKIIIGPELAYVIGAWLGDGTLATEKSNYKHYIILRVKDYEFANEWGKSLAIALGKEQPYQPNWDSDNRRWCVRASSALLYTILKKSREDPWITLPYLDPYPSDALRGLFDAEGSVHHSRYQITFINTDHQIIMIARHLLQKVKINSAIHISNMKAFMTDAYSGKIYRRKNMIIYYLRLYGQKNIVKFAESVGFTIKRKQKELEKMLRRYEGIH